MNYENGYGRDARINYQLSNIGADGEVVPIPQSFKPGEDGYDPDYQPEPITYTDANGVLRTEITGSDGSKSTIKIESPRVRAYQEKVR